MKKALCFLGTLAILLSMLAVGGIQVGAATSSLKENGFYYEVNNETATIVGFITANKVSSIPATLGGYPVTAIGNAALYGCTTLTDITLPRSVTSIGRNAFGACSNLVRVTVQSGTTFIDGGAFYGCTKLTTISLPDSITHIGHQAFYNTAYYDSVSNWTGSLLYINNQLVDAKSWTSGKQTVRAGTKTIAEASFYGCTEITDISLPDSIVTIGKQAFYNNSGLTSITLPSSLTVIDDQAFYGCNALASVAIPNRVTTIGEQAFASCQQLQSVYIPSSVTAIGEQVLSYTPSLAFIIVDASNPVYHSDGNCLIHTATKTLLAGCKTSVIPSDGRVTIIGSYAFAGQNAMTGIRIPDGVVSVYGYAFSACSALTHIAVAPSVTLFGSYAFNRCTALADVYYGGSKTQWESVSGKTASDTFQNARVHYHTLVPHWKLSEILIPATCTREGSGIYVCDCGHTIEQAIPAFGHPPYEPIETVLPTCTTEGYTIYQCPACFDTYHDDVVNPAHTFEDGVCVWCGIATEQCLAATSSDGEPMDQRWTVHQDGMVAVKLAFSSSTALADGAALSIYDGKNTLVGTYTGDQLAGQTVEVPGDTVEIHFVSDGNEASAFAVTQVSVIAPALGDLNRDAVINMTDAFSLYRAASGDTELSARQKEVADINGDGEWNMTDAYSVYRIASGG